MGPQLGNPSCNAQELFQGLFGPPIRNQQSLYKIQDFATLLMRNANESTKNMDLPTNPSDCGAKFTLLPADGKSQQQTQNGNGRRGQCKTTES